MTEWQQRVLEEHRQLVDRRAKLLLFLMSGRPDDVGLDTWALLDLQLKAMDVLEAILALRIKGFCYDRA